MRRKGNLGLFPEQTKGVKCMLVRILFPIVLAFSLLAISTAYAASLTPGNGYMNIGGTKDIYSLPDSDADIIGALAVGEPCNIITVLDDWIEIEFYVEMTGHATGWVMKNGIEKAGTMDPIVPPQNDSSTPAGSSDLPQVEGKPIPEPTPSSVYGTAIVNNANGQRLHLRETDSVDSNSLGLYYTGVEVMCNTDPSREWVSVIIGKRMGYMKSEFLYKGNDPSSVAPRTPMAAVTNNSLNGWLNLRSEPSMDGQVLGRFYNGDMVTILGVIDEWYHVKVKDAYGFMLSDYLEIIDTEPTAMPVGSREYSTTQYIMRGYTISASMVETFANNFDIAIQIDINPAIKLNSYPNSYHLYINGALAAKILTSQNINDVLILTQFAGRVTFTNDISLIQVVPVDDQGTELHDEAVVLK